jgi:hypothetical protein
MEVSEGTDALGLGLEPCEMWLEGVLQVLEGEEVLIDQGNIGQ